MSDHNGITMEIFQTRVLKSTFWQHNIVPHKWRHRQETSSTGWVSPQPASDYSQVLQPPVSGSQIRSWHSQAPSPFLTCWITRCNCSKSSWNKFPTKGRRQGPGGQFLGRLSFRQLVSNKKVKAASSRILGWRTAQMAATREPSVTSMTKMWAGAGFLGHWLVLTLETAPLLSSTLFLADHAPLGPTSTIARHCSHWPRPISLFCLGTYSLLIRTG